ncbi:MAG TPA: AAA family ATPase [Candidatus Erysipelatoclostridium merdavium]|uniref:AAA family ATPase n=1 Tax=Candidatus Erysipelatoclostridium merdavium TaxID=2838566 RepID=A0A9D1XLU0_9FIRM|nr:AAA family ATPase [Candidatus Erysipelatoclostridium merdavium]
MKEYLQENQPKFYNLIKNEFIQNKIPHAFLLVGNNTKVPLNYLAMSLICDETLACEKCNDCRKVLENKYGDIIRYDGKETSIKKGDIEYIQDTFKKSSLEGKAKIYIIENIESATKEAMNTLLKMLEEPTSGIYAIFTTNNISRVLPTILSRCQVIDIKPDSKEVIYKALIKSNIPEEAAKILTYLSASEEEAKNLYDERFEYMQTEVINFIEDLYTKRMNLIINVQTNLLKNYKERDDIKLFLNMLVLAMKDMFHVKHNQNLVFSAHYDFFNSLQIDENKLIKQIEIILETIYTIESNANLLMLMDRMMYRL